jgi:hypothetical protein
LNSILQPEPAGENMKECVEERRLKTENVAWSAASSGKRPRAFRVIGHYRGLARAVGRSQIQGDWGLFIIQKRTTQNNDDAAASCRGSGSSVVYLFCSAIHLLSFQWHSIATLLSCGSASLASQDLKIEIISAPLPLRHGLVYEKLQRPRRSEGRL